VQLPSIGLKILKLQHFQTLSDGSIIIGFRVRLKKSELCLIQRSTDMAFLRPIPKYQPFMG